MMRLMCHTCGTNLAYWSRYEDGVPCGTSGCSGTLTFTPNMARCKGPSCIRYVDVTRENGGYHTPGCLDAHITYLEDRIATFRAGLTACQKLRAELTPEPPSTATAQEAETADDDPIDPDESPCGCNRRLDFGCICYTRR